MPDAGFVMVVLVAELVLLIVLCIVPVTVVCVLIIVWFVADYVSVC